MSVSTMINFRFRSLQQFALQHVSHSHTWIIHFFPVKSFSNCYYRTRSKQYQTINSHLSLYCEANGK